MRLIFHQNRIYFLLFFLYLICFSVVQFSFTKVELFSWVNGHYSAAADSFFQLYTNVGDGWVFTALLFGCLFVSMRLSMIAALTYATTGFASQFLKRAIFPDTPRPRLYFDQHPMPIRLIEGLEVHTQHSFPSGHTISGFALFTFLTIAIANKKWAPLFFVLAFFVGYSRVYLAQHFVVDAFAGSIVGTLLTVFCFNWIDQSPLGQKNWSSKSILQLF